MRPLAKASRFEIIRIGNQFPSGFLQRLDLVRDAVLFGIDDRLFPTAETELDLALHVTRAGPGHQRIDFRRQFRRELQNPNLAARLARLRGASTRAIDTCCHEWPLRKPSRDGRGSRIRTCDLKFPKLPRYQAALYPAETNCLSA